MGVHGSMWGFTEVCGGSWKSASVLGASCLVKMTACWGETL